MSDHRPHVELIDKATPLEHHGPDDSRYAVAFGACDVPSVVTVWGDLHDKLVHANPTRFGPEGILGASNPLATAGVIDWILTHPGSVLVVAMVEVPGA